MKFDQTESQWPNEEMTDSVKIDNNTNEVDNCCNEKWTIICNNMDIGIMNEIHE